MGERLAGGSVGLALLANTLATSAVLVSWILSFGRISGAHFNPAVTLSAAWERGISWRDVAPYVCAQLAGAVAGVVVAHAMFDLAPFSFSRHERAGSSQVFSEYVATFGLVVPGLERLDWNLEDPRGKPREGVRAIRDEIRDLVVSLVEERGWAKRT